MLVHVFEETRSWIEQHADFREYYVPEDVSDLKSLNYIVFEVLVLVEIEIRCFTAL